jgi:hypothetical protein
VVAGGLGANSSLNGKGIVIICIIFPYPYPITNCYDFSLSIQNHGMRPGMFGIKMRKIKIYMFAFIILFLIGCFLN